LVRASATCRRWLVPLEREPASLHGPVLYQPGTALCSTEETLGHPVSPEDVDWTT